MLIRYLIISCLLHALSSQPPPQMARCLTGYMTDVQSWVDYYGKLLEGASQGNRIDVSYQINSIQGLYMQMQNFTCSRNTSVQFLSMARSQLNQVPRVFEFRDACRRTLSRTLTHLTLFGNDFATSNLTRRPQYEALINATNTTVIDNENVTASDLWSAGLHGVYFQNLRELDLRYCGIRELADGVFSNMPYLEKLYLGENNIFQISESTFRGLWRLVHLDISRNHEYDKNGMFQGLYFANSNVFVRLSRLYSLDLSFTKMPQRNILAFRSISRSLQRLSICKSGLSNMGSNFFAGSSLKYLDVSGNINIFGDNYVLEGVKSTLQVVYADEVALKNLDVFENLTSLEILRVSNNEISVIGKKTARSLKSLQVLNLDMNRLTTWFKPTVSLMPELKLLSIRNNNINLISEEMAQDFGNLSYIGISGNFIVCNCNVREIFELAMRNEKLREDKFISPINNSEQRRLMYHTGFDDANYLIVSRRHVEPVCIGKGCHEEVILESSGNFLLFDYDEALYHCLLVTEGRSKSFASVPSCRTRIEVDLDKGIPDTWNKLYLLIIPLFILPLLVVGYVFRRNFRYFYITMRNSAMLSLINTDDIIDENTIFNYDVFVSYCNDDRGWVLDHLLPHVEIDSNVSVCLHERDFMVGLSILENIVSCMDRSKTIMLILSQKFLLSQWCQFEMHLAQHRLLETRREDLILVLLEDIPRRVRPNTLHYLMLTNTYIVWPKEEAEQVLFWKRLNKSLVTHKMRQPDNDSLA